MAPWVFFVFTTIVAYIGISLFSQLSGGSSQSPLSALFSVLRPVPFLVMLLANMFYALAIYYGLTVMRYAIPAAVAIGLITSFAYSALVLGAEVTLIKLLGAAVIIIGVALLAI